MRWTIVAPWLFTIGLFVALLGAAAAAGQYQVIRGAASSAELVAFFGLIGLWGVADATVGAIIVSRRPGNRIGRVLQVGGPLLISVFLAFLVSAIRRLTAGPGDPIGALAGWWASITILPAILVAFAIVAILFPDGRLPGPRWRWPVALVTVGQIAISGVWAITAGPMGEGLADNPFGIVRLPAEVAAILISAGSLLLVLALGMAVMAIALRWYRGDRLARAQLKWLLGALAVGAVLFPLGFGGDLLNAFDFLGVASGILVPIAIGIAVLRHGLYEIDRIISRTLTYGVLTVVLVAVYVAGFGLVQAVLAPFTSGGGPVAVAASTLAVFALFQPLQSRIRGAMDRRFNRSRYDAQHTVDGFAAHLREEVDLDRLASELRAVVGLSLAPTSVGVWLRPSERTAGR
jgi:hypothetical protein